MDTHEAAHFWFPYRSATGAWDVIHANLKDKRIFVYGHATSARIARLTQWVDHWVGHSHGLQWVTGGHIRHA